jgi:transcriptional regulator with XRE-family HTH domain
MTKISTLHKKWVKDPAYKAAYESLSTEFELAQKLIEVRVKSGMSQEELAQRMGTSQSAIARLESGSAMPSMRTLTKLALATDCEMRIDFKPRAKSANSRASA